jgi:hypothetical protein
MILGTVSTDFLAFAVHCTVAETIYPCSTHTAWAQFIQNDGEASVHRLQ